MTVVKDTLDVKQNRAASGRPYFYFLRHRYMFFDAGLLRLHYFEGNLAVIVIERTDCHIHAH
jgi:hypothetical protein